MPPKIPKRGIAYDRCQERLIKFFILDDTEDELEVRMSENEEIRRAEGRDVVERENSSGMQMLIHKQNIQTPSITVP